MNSAGASSSKYPRNFHQVPSGLCVKTGSKLEGRAGTRGPELARKAWGKPFLPWPLPRGLLRGEGSRSRAFGCVGGWRAADSTMEPPAPAPRPPRAKLHAPPRGRAPRPGEAAPPQPRLPRARAPRPRPAPAPARRGAAESPAPEAQPWHLCAQARPRPPAPTPSARLPGPSPRSRCRPPLGRPAPLPSRVAPRPGPALECGRSPRSGPAAPSDSVRRAHRHRPRRLGAPPHLPRRRGGRSGGPPCCVTTRPLLLLRPPPPAALLASPAPDHDRCPRGCGSFPRPPWAPAQPGGRASTGEKKRRRRHG